MRFTAVATLRDEGPYIWEWVAYHKSIGFDNIIIYQNDSIDYSVEILNLLAAKGAIKYFDNSGLEPGANQIIAYQRSAQEPEYLSADWVMAIDLDEFLVINTPEGTLRSLVEAVPDTDTDNIIINWRRYGSSGFQTIPGGSVLQSFTWADWPDATRVGKVGYKSFFRRDRWGHPGIHLPKLFRVKGQMPRQVNGSGLKEGEFNIARHLCDDQLCQKLAQVNHYIVRDASSFLIKVVKWKTYFPQRQVGEKYWAIHNTNFSRDRSAHRFLKQLAGVMAQLDADAKGWLSRLTNLSLQRHRALAASLSDRPDFEDLIKFISDNNKLPTEREMGSSRENKMAM